MNIRCAQIPDDVPAVRQLLREYAGDIGISLCFQNFDAELAELPGSYAPPDGRLLVAEVDGKPAGCVAMRKHDFETAELKRLFVRPEFRGLGLGRELLKRIVAEAIAAGYRHAIFDTLPSMKVALKMYREFGFVESEPYRDNPVCGALYFRKSLT